MSEFVPSEIVVMRTPLLPMEELERWSAELRAASSDDTLLDDALAHDRRLLRTRLQSLLERPEIAEAIFLASPDLAESLEQWRRDPESKKGRRTEQGLVRYFLRMASRPTPFGLFSGCTPGRVGERTQLALAPRDVYRRHSRLDMDYLFALCEHLTRDPAVRVELTFRPNSSLYETAGRLRFAESRVRGRLRTYHLVAVDSFDALRDTLRRAANGARLDDLAIALVASDPDGEITREDADAFLHDLVDNQLLIPDLALPVTGDENGLLRQLEALQSTGDARTRLGQAEKALANIDANGVGSSPDRYRELARDLEPLGIPVELSKLFQVDLIKPASQFILGEQQAAEIMRGIELLHRFSHSRHARALDEFRSAFQERYGADREIPLLEALDEESGVGFERAANAVADASPLLSGLSLQRRGGGTRMTWGNAEAAQLQLLTRALAEGRMEVSITGEDVQRLENPDRPPIPDAFHAIATIAASSADAVARGDYRVVLHAAMGPSGARMLGRFCHADDAIRECVEKHLAAEEALQPDAVFAELVHLPAGRVGNILARPVLRAYEIPFLGCSGAPRERQISVDDLLVTVSGDRIRLRSRTLDREVIPRLSTAHNTMAESLGVYRFLAALQETIGMRWDWGPLDTAPFLPRIVSGRIVLQRARWRIGMEHFKPVVSATGAERYRLAQRFRETHRMPRYVMLTDNDQELLVDFENTLALDAVLDVIRTRYEIVLTEVYPAPDELCANGPEGRFFHELIVPYAKRLAAARSAARENKAPSLHVARTFPPGSEWLYAKFYSGTATADRVLTEELAPLAAAAVANGDARRWFFIRYADPQWHLRVRFHGDPLLLRERLRPALEAAAQRLLDGGAIWKMQFDTYEREVERYGGPEAIELAEEIFYRDSEAVAAMLESCNGDAGSDVRWRLMLAGIDRLLADFGYDLDAKLRAAEHSRDAFARQYKYDAAREPLADRFRRDRASLQSLLDAPTAPHPALDHRSTTLAPTIRELLARERRHRLHPALPTILPSLLHMHVNRLSRSSGPEHELVLYDYLVQLYRGEVARRGKVRKELPLAAMTEG